MAEHEGFGHIAKNRDGRPVTKFSEKKTPDRVEDAIIFGRGHCASTQLGAVRVGASLKARST